jgi:23S rRNA pseudouridine2605 synthase
LRLQKYLAMNGIASRRKCEEYIAAGMVAVNGQTVTEMGTQVDPDQDEVTFNGNPVKRVHQKVTIMLHKPIGVLSTASDEFDRPTVVDLVNYDERLYPVGRLDYLTSGLLLLTNDGDLALRLTHPRHQKEKVYHAWLFGIITEEKMDLFRKGLQIEDYVTSPARIKVILKEKDRCLVEIGLKEGRNRQVRKMCEVLGYPVINLKRVSVGGLTLGDLKPGEWRLLSEKELSLLMGREGEQS